MNKIVYGGRVFTDHEIDSGSLHLATNLISAQLEANTFTAVVRSSDATLTSFERNAKLVFYVDDKQSGIFYVQSIDRVAGEKYKIFATSAVGLLIEGQHYGGIYTGQTAQEIIADICGSVPFIVKNNLAGIKLYGWLPIASPRDNLSQVLFAIGAALKTDLDGILRIAGLWDGVSGTTGKDRLYEGGKVEYTAKITQVVLTEHQYSEGGETKKLFEGTAQAGDIITFNSPMYSLSATGFSIQASGANWARVSGGSGALTGKEYIHNTRLITRDVQTSNTPNVKTVDKATLVSLVNSSAVADRLVSYFKCKETINASVVYHGENTGNIMSTYHPFDNAQVNACLQSADVTLSKKMKAQEKSLVGFAPAQESGIEYEDRHETITSNGTWTVPDGVEEVTVVCIGGGTGGYSGHNGSNVSGTTQVGFQQNMDDSSYKDRGQGLYPGKGCPGGEGGNPGLGGKIFTATINVTEGDVIQATIGVGGSGGSPSSTGSNPGSNGSATIFGSVSSESGGASAAGYTDIVTGERYATQGLVGIKGGRGGSMERVSTPSGLPTQGEYVTDRNGVVWSPGLAPAPSDRLKVHHSSVIDNKESVGTVEGYSGRGVGGGAAAGGNGGGGSISYSGGASSSVVTVYGGTGGRGGNAAAPPKRTVRGGGGDGGHGGGGGGGPGSCFAHYRVKKSSSVTPSLNPTEGSCGSGGSGSAGGQGGDGIIILNYRIPKIVSSGQFVDKNGKRFMDKFIRRLIV